MMVLSLVSGNLAAQKSCNLNAGKEILENYFKNVEYSEPDEISLPVTNTSINDEQPLMDWMINSSETNSESLYEAAGFEENDMVMEDWMMKSNWENKTLLNEEFQLEGWMIELNPDGNSSLEAEMKVDVIWASAN